MILVFAVLGSFPAKFGPDTRSNESGSINGEECISNYLRRPNMRPFRDHVLLRADKLTCKMVA